jgi:hypothetical protein
MTKKSNMTNETKVWNVYSQKVAVELRKRGFKIVRTEPNNKYPQYDMYGFENTPEFQKALKEITG